MLAVIPKLESGARTTFIVRIHPIRITLATCYLDQVSLNLDLEGIFLQLNKRATTTINTEGFGKCNNLTRTLRYVRNRLAAIHQVSMVGLNVALPHRRFLYRNHITNPSSRPAYCRAA